MRHLLRLSFGLVTFVSMIECSDNLPQTMDGGDAASSDTAVDVIADSAVDACATVDTTSDPLNCGVCGKDCLGGTCTNGKCGPVYVSKTEVLVGDIAADATGAYWLFQGNSQNYYTDGYVKHVGFANHAPVVKTVVPNGSPGSVAADGTRAYIGLFGTYKTVGYAGDGTVIACTNFDCSSATTLGANGSSYSNVAINSTTAYWYTLPGDGGTTPTLMSSPKTGGGATAMKNGNIAAQWMRADATHIYGVAAGLQQYTLPAGGWKTIDFENASMGSLAIDANFAYFVIVQPLQSATVLRCDIPDCNGGSITMANDPKNGSIYAVAVGAERLFWNQYLAVYTCLKSSCDTTTEVLIPGTPTGGIFAMAEYNGVLYWGDNQGSFAYIVY